MGRMKNTLSGDVEIRLHINRKLLDGLNKMVNEYNDVNETRITKAQYLRKLIMQDAGLTLEDFI